MTDRLDVPEPCTERAREQGCTCSVPTATAYDFDPPEPKWDKYCPLHGWAPDPDDAYDRSRDDKMDKWSNCMNRIVPDPCTEEAFEQGCTCSVPTATAYDFDPPEPKWDKYCPLHGWAPDPDEARDRAMDDARDFPDIDPGEDDGF